MEKKIISYSLEHLQDSKFQLEILTDDGVTLFQGDITDCQKHINYFIYDNPNAKFGSEPNEVLNLNNNEYVDYRQQVTEQFNPRLFNKPSKELPTVTMSNIHRRLSMLTVTVLQKIAKACVDRSAKILNKL
jgi:hypothetical protein